MPTVAAMSVIVIPFAKSKIIRARLASPAERVGARCQARSVWRSAGVRRMLKEVLRPLTIQGPHRQQRASSAGVGKSTIGLYARERPHRLYILKDTIE